MEYHIKHQPTLADLQKLITHMNYEAQRMTLVSEARRGFLSGDNLIDFTRFVATEFTKPLLEQCMMLEYFADKLTPKNIKHVYNSLLNNKIRLPSIEIKILRESQRLELRK